MALIETAPRVPQLSRRQALKIVAAVAAVPVAVGAVRWFAPQPQFFTWNGSAMGGQASLSLWHPDADFANRTIARMLSEVGRLEAIFSLFRPDSELSRLNAAGSLASASPDLVAVLELARDMAHASGGAFDVTVQPLWNLYAAHFAAAGADPAGPSAEAVRAVLPLVDYAAIDLAARAVTLRPGMAVTLNAIAQGYITDRVADLLRNEGFDHVVVELGETRVLGDQPDGAGPWIVGIRDRSGLANRTIDLSDRALSVSGGYGTVFEPSGTVHHIFNPDTGRSADGVTTVAVTHPRASVADGLSTAIVVAGEARASALLAAYPGATALVIRGDGSTVSL